MNGLRLNKMQQPAIALLTDFGLNDFFVASLKAVILSINPAARMVDISHNVPPYDIRAGSFILAACAPFFPPGTIFVSIVDPGVGSGRQILLARTAKHDFIAPDNGLLTLALDAPGKLELRSITATKFFLSGSSCTFEGRDKMAPAAAWLSLGTSPAELGPRLDGYERHPVRRPFREKGRIAGEVAYVDRFGNLITNIPNAWLSGSGRGAAPRFRMRIRGRTIDAFPECYARGPRDEPFALPGSLGTLEVALRRDSAAARLKVRVGDEVTLAPR
jgi:S-adenosylmethionine hydrolase